MYHYPSQRLDSPPPQSQFRRPWSPLETNPHSPRSVPQGFRPQSPDAESSVEVFDLADYSRVLPHQDNFSYGDYASQSRPYYPEYPATPPRSFSLASRASMSTSPPSLASEPSSASHSHTARLYTPPPSHRPFSLPPPRVSSPSPHSNSGRSHNYPWLTDSQDITDSQNVDVSTFPEWSRNWYATNKLAKAALDRYAPIPTFDPALVSSSYDPSNGYGPARPYASTDESHRDLLPWSLDDDSTSKRITPEMKEERMRMLEREFGRNGMKQGVWDTKILGSVDAKGNIITPGPKKRFIVRLMEGLFAFGAALASLYSALILKPEGSPPPRGTVPAYLLYILSVVTFVLLVYVFVVIPYCCPGKRSQKATKEGPAGMMVLPVQQLPGASKKKEKGKKNRKEDAEGRIFVNLIVDPTMFSGLNGRDREESDGEDTETIPRSGGRRRRGIFEGLAMEEQWKAARKRLKHMLHFDVALFILWGAEFVVILLGKRCPVGEFEGWCDGYNVATALAAFLAISFCFSVFFDVKDLHLSKASPRTRT
ncbi:hypothetical protein A7U60_g8959 [Sanghuangporus baumii]|uniref:Uncharacterized protein n=1 Tax=Sanghuangporus baumii TaxID=108892 RepID=A0A9Q5HQT2_SANBA|nr:hypothetical protein A7U60_g8959 [Sanghuangporus baumii]